MRLDKYLADCGVGTRSEIKKLIRSGAVAVAGVAKTAPDMKIDENTAKVFLNGVLIKYRRFVYLMLNKPVGYVSATWDKYKPTVIDLVPEEYLHFNLFPVGRLDIDTVGLCLLTNDGAIAHRLISPDKHVSKTYFAKVDGLIKKSDIEMFASGMDMGDFIAKPALLKPLSDCEAEVIIFEGKFHQVKRMFKKTGNTVLYLKRTAMNKLQLDPALKEGEVRELTDSELELLTDGM